MLFQGKLNNVRVKITKEEIKAMSKTQQKQKLTQTDPKYFKYLNYQIQNISIEKVGQMENIEDNKNKPKYVCNYNKYKQINCFN